MVCLHTFSHCNNVICSSFTIENENFNGFLDTTLVIKLFLQILSNKISLLQGISENYSWKPLLYQMLQDELG